MITSPVEPRPKRLPDDVLHREEVKRPALATGLYFASLFFEERGHVVAKLFAKGSREEEQEVSGVELMVPMVEMDLLVAVEVQLKLAMVEMEEMEYVLLEILVLQMMVEMAEIHFM